MFNSMCNVSKSVKGNVYNLGSWVPSVFSIMISLLGKAFTVYSKNLKYCQTMLTHIKVYTGKVCIHNNNNNSCKTWKYTPGL